MVKIKSFKVRESCSVALPRLWMQDTSVKPGDSLDIYQDTAGRLIIVPLGVSPSAISDVISVQGRELAEFIEAHKGGAVA